MIREFNLNELFQKSKKLNKGRALKGEEQNEPELDDSGNELDSNDNPEQPTESKKDKWERSETGCTKPFLHMFNRY